MILVLVLLTVQAKLEDHSSKGCFECEYCCLSTNTCGSQEYCQERLPLVIYLQLLFGLVSILFLGVTTWHVLKKIN